MRKTGTDLVPNFGTDSSTKNENGFGSKFGYLSRYQILEPNPFPFWVPDMAVILKLQYEQTFGTKNGNGFGSKFGYLDRYQKQERIWFQIWVPVQVPKFGTKSVPVFGTKSVPVLGTSDCTLGQLRAALSTGMWGGLRATLSTGARGGLRRPKCWRMWWQALP